MLDGIKVDKGSCAGYWNLVSFFFMTVNVSSVWGFKVDETSEVKTLVHISAILGLILQTMAKGGICFEESFR